MMMPKNNIGVTTAAAPGGKTSMTVFPYSAPAAAAGDNFQQMTMPLNGQYPIASKFLRRYFAIQ